MLKLWDFECIWGHVFEALVEGDEQPICPKCEVIEQATGGTSMTGPGAAVKRVPFTQGTAARAEVNPAKTREMFSKAQEMRNKVQGRTPWRKNSYSQTGNE
jgi:hypothetical protein